MFKKPFRIKSNNQVKTSERKNVKELFTKHFPNVQDAKVNLLFNNKKESLNCIKLVTHDNEPVQVYCLQKQPIFFLVKDQLLPTIFLLWKMPDLIPNFIIHPDVMKFIRSGADLMLPGITTPPTHSERLKYGNVAAGMPVYVGLTQNIAAMAIGLTAISSFDMERANGKGKCIIVYHSIGDNLCNIDGYTNQSAPNLGPPEWLTLTNYDADFPMLGAEESQINRNTSTDADCLENESDNVMDMDELLNYCFMASIKYSKTLSLPVLVSNFFKLQMLPVCPPGKSLDIKKTSYKKLKTFLEEMCKNQLITIKEIKKGVEAITEINTGHAKYNEFYLKPENRPKKDANDESELKQTKVTESYIITRNALPIFQNYGYHKGDTIDISNVRRLTTEYIKQNNCLSLENTKLIIPNTDVLKELCKTQNPITWEETFEKICDSMTNCFKINNGIDEILSKGKLSPITMNISLRASNKKVTLVDNLETFGININEFSKECQHGVASSTSIIPKTPGKKCDQLLVQGNQIVFIYNLLTEKYKVPKRYILGLEKAPKKKK